jgi:hypothetical protein
LAAVAADSVAVAVVVEVLVVAMIEAQAKRAGKSKAPHLRGFFL